MLHHMRRMHAAEPSLHQGRHAESLSSEISQSSSEISQSSSEISQNDGTKHGEYNIKENAGSAGVQDAASTHLSSVHNEKYNSTLLYRSPRYGLHGHEVTNACAAYTIAWICATWIEFRASVALLDDQHEEPVDFVQQPSDKSLYAWGRIGVHDITIVSVGDGTTVANIVPHVVRCFPQLRFGLLVGIGSRIPSKTHDVRLGDVVVGRYGRTSRKVVQADDGQMKTVFFVEKDDIKDPPAVLSSALKHILLELYLENTGIPKFVDDIFAKHPQTMGPKPGHIHQQGAENYTSFSEAGAQTNSPRCRNSINCYPLPRNEEDANNPAIHHSVIASSITTVEAVETRDSLVVKAHEDVEKECICFETEAAGLTGPFPCLLIRGICNYAKSNKDDEWQRYAAAMAAAFAKELLGYVSKDVLDETQTIGRSCMDRLSDSPGSKNSLNASLSKSSLVEAWTSVYGPMLEEFTLFPASPLRTGEPNANKFHEIAHAIKYMSENQRRPERQNVLSREDPASRDVKFLRLWLEWYGSNHERTRACDITLQQVQNLAAIMNKDLTYIADLCKLELRFDDDTYVQAQTSKVRAQALAQKYADEAMNRACAKSGGSIGPFQCIFPDCNYRTTIVVALKRHLDVRLPSTVFVCEKCFSDSSVTQFIHQRKDKFLHHLKMSHQISDHESQRENEKRSTFHPPAKSKLKCGFCTSEFRIFYEFRNHVINHFKDGDLAHEGREWDVKQDWRVSSTPTNDDKLPDSGSLEESQSNDCSASGDDEVDDDLEDVHGNTLTTDGEVIHAIPTQTSTGV